MPGPYGATDGGKLVMRAGCVVAVKGLVAGCIGGENICLRIVRKSFILIL